MPHTAHYRLAVTLACLAAAGGLLAGQAPAPPQETPTFRAGIEAVQVTVVVTDGDGNPVTGLTGADFEILENGRPQPITTFSAVDLPVDTSGTPSTATRDVEANDRPPGRIYLIALDDMSGDNALRTRHFLRQFLERHFAPGDTAAVVLTTRGPRDSGQEFIGNVRLLLNAIDRFGGGDSDAGALRTRNIMGSLKDLTEMLAKVPGRKALIFITEGIGSDAPGSSCGCNPFELIGYKPGPLGGMFSNIDRDFHDAVSAATRGNVAIYPVNPAGLTPELTAPESFDTSRMDRAMVLRGLAQVTGGFALTESNNYEGAFARLVREQSTYYLLGFNSAEERRDGRYVSVEVRVRRPGLQVRSLDGYVAPRSRQDTRRTPDTVLRAVWEALANPITSGGVPMRVFAAPFKHPRRDASVALALEIAPSKLNLVERDGAHRGELELLIAVTDASKRRWPIMRHRAALALKPATYERVSQTALRVISQLTLPEGRYQIRVSAGGASIAGSVVYDVTVPDFRKNFAMSGLVLTSVRANGLLTVIPHAQLDAALLAPPTTIREFSQDDTLVLFAELYENRRRAHTVDVTVELRGAAGEVVGRHTLQRASDRPAGASTYPLLQQISLQDVAPGSYTVVMQARSSLDRNAVSREVPIVVTDASTPIVTGAIP